MTRAATVRRQELRVGPDGSTMFDMHDSASFAAWERAWSKHLNTVPDAPITVERDDAGRGFAAPDPEQKRRHDEAMAFVRDYTGSFGLILSIRADTRWGTKYMRLSDRQVEVILASKQRDIEWAQRREAMVTQQHLQVPQVMTAVLEAGMYQSPVDGAIYKVQKAVHGSGNLYAKRLILDEGNQSAEFVYTPGAIRLIRPEWRMTLDQASAFGKLYGICCVCSATLTDEKSIAAGIGPVCGKRV